MGTTTKPTTIHAPSEGERQHYGRPMKGSGDPIIDAMRKENKELRDRLRELERENEELRKAIESAWGVIDDVIGECGCTQPNEILGSPPCFRCEKLELSAQALERTRKGELP